MAKRRINLEVNPTAEKIRLISIELSVVAIIALYLTGVVMAFFDSGFRTCFNFSAIIAAFKNTAFQYELFFFFFFAGAAIVAFTAYKQISYIDRKDLFGRFLFGTDGAYGTARFARIEELDTIAKKEPIEDAYGTIFGQFTTGGKKVFDYKMSDGKHNNDLSNRNIMAIGATGSGKTFGFVQPYLLQAVKRRESVILPDPAGELYKRYTWFLRESCGYKVHHIIFNDELGIKSAGWNVLSVLKGDPEIDAAILSQIIFQATGAASKPDAHVEMARMLFEAIYLYIMLDPYRKPYKKVWAELIDIIGNQAGFAYFDEIFSTSNIDVKQVPAQQLYYRCKASENFGTNILATLRSNLKISATTIMKTVLSTDEIDIYEAGRVPTVIFCQFPEGNEAFKLLTSMFFALSFIALYNYADSMPAGRLPVHVNFLIDEAKAVGRIPDLEDKLVTMRKRNMSLCTIFQDISQFQKLYGMDTWNTLFGASAVKMILGAQDDTTPKLISQYIGDATVETKQESRDAYETPTKQSRESKIGQTRRPLLTPDEVRGLGEKEMILVLFAYRSPVILYRCYANLHPLYSQATKPFYITSVPDIYDKKHRQLYIDYCNAIYDRYYETHKNIEPDYSEVWRSNTIFDRLGLSRSRKKNKTTAVKNVNEEAEKQFRNPPTEETPKKQRPKSEKPKKSKPNKKNNNSGIRIDPNYREKLYETQKLVRNDQPDYENQPWLQQEPTNQPQNQATARPIQQQRPVQQQTTVNQQPNASDLDGKNPTQELNKQPIQNQQTQNQPAAHPEPVQQKPIVTKPTEEQPVPASPEPVREEPKQEPKPEPKPEEKPVEQPKKEPKKEEQGQAKSIQEQMMDSYRESNTSNGRKNNNGEYKWDPDFGKSKRRRNTVEPPK